MYLEKWLALLRLAWKKIILPRENQADFEKLPAKIKDNITVHYAETFYDIYTIAFESKSFSECCITVSKKNEVEEPQLSNIMFVRLIGRRVRMELSGPEESEDEKNMFHNFKPRY